MIMNLFSQFETPQIMGFPLMMFALFFPALLLSQTPRIASNQTTFIQEWLTSSLTKQLLSPMNKSGHNWSLPLITLLLFLLLINLLGLLPYTFTPTTQLALNMGLALPLWTMTIMKGIRFHLSSTLSHLLPMGTPALLIPALVLIETASLLIRPLALGVRLTANLTAGHLLMQLISSTTLALLPSLPALSLITLLILTLLTCLEMAVALIQAYVFTLLVTLYLQENL